MSISWIGSSLTMTLKSLLIMIMKKEYFHRFKTKVNLWKRRKIWRHIRIDIKVTSSEFRSRILLQLRTLGTSTTPWVPSIPILKNPYDYKSSITSQWCFSRGISSRSPTIQITRYFRRTPRMWPISYMMIDLEMTRKVSRSLPFQQ